MAHLPAITLTDPNDLDQAPYPAQSPTKDSAYGDLALRIGAARPGTGGRPDSSNGWPSPGRLIRTLSNNAPPQQTTPAAPREGTTGSKEETQQAIDPLSQHILRRAHTPLNAPTNNSPRPRTSDGGGHAAHKYDKRSSADEKPAVPAVLEPVTRTDTIDSTTHSTALKDLKKGAKAVSFLSRLMGGAKKKDTEDSVVDDVSETSDGRPEGNDAEVFTQRVDNMGFNPRHPQPPGYIKVRAKNKKERDFDRVFLAQELRCSKRPKMGRSGSSNKLRRKSSQSPSDSDTVWAMEFSRDGKYLAAAGADMIVRIWAVLSNLGDRQQHEKQESKESEANGVDAHAEHLSAPVFQSKPICEYEGHTSTVLDLSWSKNNFLLSSSMDKTVRLWHVSRSECLCTFKHNDFVPSICFHPKDDRFFLAGSLDSKLRLWSIPDKSVAYAAQLPEMITAVAFTPDGKFAMAGCLNGLCMFYETEGLKYQTQILVRSTRGQNAKGSKITGIQTQYGASGDIKVLITSNDSRIRLYNFRDKSLELKFKGNENNCSQIRAALSDDGRYVVCGSEDRKAYIWSLHQSHGEKRDKTPLECFEAHDAITTAICIAPTKTRQHLGKSEDPVYDLCNPPPVTLLSHAEHAESQSSRPPTENGSIQATPVDDRFERPKESAGYITRSGHKEGNIIVTADFTGKIKVFRQDCAWSKRMKDDSDRASLFAKRGGKGNRTASLATKTSQSSLRQPRTSTSTQPPSDRILSWRQGIASTPSIAESKNGTPKESSSRSISPSKSLDRRGRSNKPTSVKSAHPLSDTLARSPSPTDTRKSSDEAQQPSSVPAARSIQHNAQENPLALQGDRSYIFWDQKVWAAHAERVHKMAEAHESDPGLGRVRSATERTGSGGGAEATVDHDHLAVGPPLHQVNTYVSQLTDERSERSATDDDEFDDAREQNAGDDTSMKCSRCGSVSFSARRGKEGSTRLVCTKCGESA